MQTPMPTSLAAPFSPIRAQEGRINTNFNRLQSYISFTVKPPQYLSICSFLLHSIELCAFFMQIEFTPRHSFNSS